MLRAKARRRERMPEGPRLQLERWRCSRREEEEGGREKGEEGCRLLGTRCEWPRRGEEEEEEAEEEGREGWLPARVMRA